jgi:hypothetical protein
MSNYHNVPDVTSIIDRIDQRIAAQRQQAPFLQNGLPFFPELVYPGKPADISYDLKLYGLLAEVANHYPTFERDLNITPSALDKIPLIGRLWHAVRRQLHEIALFYTRRVSTHQAQTNYMLLQVVERLTVLSQQQQREISTLQARLSEQQTLRSADVDF